MNILIKSLKQAIYALENDLVYYKWNSQESCNCGVVMQAMLGCTAKDLRKRFNVASKSLPDSISTWSDVSKANCSVTGVPQEELFITLVNAGLSIKDMNHLEYLSDPEVIALLPVEKRKRWFLGKTITYRRELSHDQKEDVIIYLKAWVQLLEQKSPAVEEAKQILAVEPVKEEIQ